jgi:hypothetical protein
MGLSGIPADVLIAWVQASVNRQGLELAVSNPATVQHVMALLTGRGAANRATARVAGAVGDPEPSDPPNGFDAFAIESGAIPGCGMDDHVVDDLGDDRGLPGEVQF